MDFSILENRVSDVISSKWSFISIFIIALLLRLIEPTFKLLHHDEAIHAWFSYELITDGTYLYDPMYHGPLLYYLTGTAFKLFGDSDLVVRVLPALFGVAIVPLIYLIYRYGFLKREHAIFASLFFAVSPDMVYFSRFLRHDIFQLFFTVLVIVALIAYFKSEKGRFALLAGAACACGLCLKEDMPFTLMIFFSFLLFIILSGKLNLPKTWPRDLVCSIIVAAGIGFVFYSSFFLHPEMFFEAPFKAIEHWVGMHNECRLCGGPYWYLLVLLLYELPLLLLALYNIGEWIKDGGLKEVITRGREVDCKNILMGLSIWWMICSMTFYAYVGEKVPWLLIHQLFPIIILASYKIEGKKSIAAVIAVILLLIMTFHVCYTPGDINEPIVQVQNSEELRDVMDLIDISDRVVLASDSYWPLPWYYRGDRWDKILFYGEKVGQDVINDSNPDLVILHDTDSYESLPGYEKLVYRLSYWFSWYDNQDRVPEWFLLRDGRSGSVNLDLFVKPEILNKTLINVQL